MCEVCKRCWEVLNFGSFSRQDENDENKFVKFGPLVVVQEAAKFDDELVIKIWNDSDEYQNNFLTANKCINIIKEYAEVKRALVQKEAKKEMKELVVEDEISNDQDDDSDDSEMETLGLDIVLDQLVDMARDPECVGRQMPCLALPMQHIRARVPREEFIDQFIETWKKSVAEKQKELMLLCAMTPRRFSNGNVSLNDMFIRIRRGYFPETSLAAQAIQAMYDKSWIELRNQIVGGLCLWSADDAVVCAYRGEEHLFQSKAELFKKDSCFSVRDALESLNTLEGHIACPEGFCVVYSERIGVFSERIGVYILCRRSDKNVSIESLPSRCQLVPPLRLSDIKKRNLFF